jgi:predicted nicotinamide N-methyase
VVAEQGVPLQRATLDLGGTLVPLWRAASLERFVDADSLLRAEAAPEPPYWMHLWPGALALARKVLADASIGSESRVVELGAGLGLPALVAARRGARVVATDWQRAPLRVLGRSLADNGVAAPCVQMDWARPALRSGFDLCLGADVGYDRAAEAPLVAALARLLRPGGRAWLADSVNTARTSLGETLTARGFTVASREVREEEEGRAVWVRVIEAQFP